MNLRKDHSHIIQTHSCEFFGEGLRARRLAAAFRANAQGWWGELRNVLRLVPTASSRCKASLTSSLSHSCRWLSRATSTHSQLSAMDVSVRSTMKGAAKCDKHCELQISVNRQGLERILCFWDIPESMPASVSTLCCSSSCRSSRGMLLAISCASGRAPSALLRCSMDKALLRQPAY